MNPKTIEGISEEILETPIYFTTLNGVNKVMNKIVTPFPKEFGAEGTISWKVINLTGRKYDAIIGQNVLVPFKSKIDLEGKFIEILNKNKIPFIELDYPLLLNEIHNIEPLNQNILEKLNLNHLNNEEADKLNELLKQFKDLFYIEGENLTFTHEIQHEIYTSMENPVYSKIYRYPRVHEKEIEKQIKEMLDQKIIMESTSPYNSPLWIVPKKIDNSGKQKWRIVIDYRKINEITISDKFPIPNIENILDKLGKSQYFTTLDLAKGFHQILVAEKDRRKTAFSIPFGHYEYVRMPFGLKNAPATFQRLMNTVLKEYINKTCVVYLDDILIFSTSLEEHLTNVKDIFRTLRKAGLKVQVDKCSFLSKETEYLGHILTPNGVKPNPKKIKTIQDLKLPTTQKQIKSFLGVTGYYRKFIKDYAKVAYSMTKYLKKNEKVNTNDPNYICAFEKLKEIITEHPILKYPNFNKKFKLVTDASNFAIGAVLTQEEHPICYASRTLNNHEKNYSTIEKELLAIVWGTKYFRPYLYGKEFDLQTDHQPIKWLHIKHSGKDINPRLQRWLLSLGEYNINIDYIKGKDNKIADFLSRINTETNEINSTETFEKYETDLSQCFSDLFYEPLEEINANDTLEMQTIHSQEEEQNDHFPILETIVNRFKSQIILCEEKQKEYETVFKNHRVFIDKKDLNSEKLTEILKKYIIGKTAIFSYLNDHEYNKLQQNIIQNFDTNSIKFVKCSSFAEDIENEDKLKKQISLFHKNETGHSGIIATYEDIKNRVYHPKLRQHIHILINNCDICNRSKYDRKPIKEKFRETETPENINEIIHVDTYVNSKNTFINFIDKLTKHVICLHLENRHHTSLIEKIKLFISIKEKPKKFIFDNEFKTNVKEFLNGEQIEYHSTKPNSHTGNSDIERFHNTITERIRTLNIENKKPIRDQMLEAVKFYNNTFHSTIKTTPQKAQNKEIPIEDLVNSIKVAKSKWLNKRNSKREEYKEDRKFGYVKNYKSLRHKEEPKFRKLPLENIHSSNIKKQFKFSDDNHYDNMDVDANSTNATNVNSG